jgi:hypothetical protein
MNIIRITQPKPEFILNSILTWFIEENNSEPIVASKFCKIYKNENYGFLQPYVKSFKGPKKLITENPSPIDYQGNKYKIIWKDDNQSHGKGQIFIRNITTNSKETIESKSLPKECIYCNKKFKTINALNGHLKVHKEEKEEFEEFKKWNNKKKSSDLVDSLTEEMFEINSNDLDLNSKNTFKYWNNLHAKIGKQSVTSHNDFSKEYKKVYGKNYIEDTKISYDDYINIATACSSASFLSDDRYKIEAYEDLLKGLHTFNTNYKLSKINWSRKTFNDWDDELKKEKMKESFCQKGSEDKEMNIVEFYRNYFLNN